MIARKRKTAGTTDTRRQMAELQIELRETDRELGKLNWDLATELIRLSDETNDPAALIEAVEALRSATRYYTFEDAPREHALVQKRLADTLLVLGQRTDDRDALASARDAYRGAITLASLLSDDALREDLRATYKITLALLGDAPKTAPLFRVA
ncbi:hypothetical protein [uncultured Algimonas sp.]|uniref:hypothetical protein n=1 Tax=uncultured Algimonas sp. TaxID=1547920 RepID=UPI00262FDED6|nr:hypothetical protein [uncultured Algimonas sp.]